MAFTGWLAFGGEELINAARTRAYVEHMMPEFGLENCVECGDLADALGHKPYTTPLVDQPDWFDPIDNDTWGFCGLYPLSITGLDSSTATATVTESIGHGGYVTGRRRATREITVSGLLIGTEAAAVQAGLAWLKVALSGTECTVADGCNGDHLCFFSICPELCDDPDPNRGGGVIPVHAIPLYLCPSGEQVSADDECVLPYERHLFRVVRTSGPTVAQEYDLACGSMIRVEFTLVAGVPWTYGPPLLAARVTPGVGPSFMVSDPVCEASTPGTLVDPDCPPVPAPPRPPVIVTDCLETPQAWRRYVLTIDPALVETVFGSVPVIHLTPAGEDVRQVRIRFWPNPLNWGSFLDPDTGVPRLDECTGWCGEFIVSYAPADSEMVIDGVAQQAQVTTPAGDVLAANHLLYAGDGGPVEWPLLECGIPYFMTLDVVPDIPQVGISVCLATRAG